ncbi:MAG TPA: hypothetical protein VGA36_09340 [Nitriliruptorales bacterium]
MTVFVDVVLVIAGGMHLLPVVGAAGGPALNRLYGVDVRGPNELLLLRHRALLFGILGALMIAGAVDSDVELPALIAGLVSTLSFVILARGEHNEALRRVANLDILLAAGLAVALAWRVAAG